MDNKAIDIHPVLMNLDNTMLSEKKSDIKGRTYTEHFLCKISE